MTEKFKTRKPISAINRISAAAMYTIKKRGLLLLSWLIIVFLVILVLGLKTAWALGGPWGWVQNLATCLTLVIAVLIWVSERYREWNESLPKRLTARFFIRNKGAEKEVMVCEEAYLAGESDIRAWAQQLGLQMSDGEPLKFFPDLNQSNPEVLRDPGKGVLFTHYTISVRLRTLPKSLENILQNMQSPKFPLLHWAPPDFFDERYPALEHPVKSDFSQKQTP